MSDSEAELIARLSAVPTKHFQAYELASSLNLPKAEINRLLYKVLQPRDCVKSFKNKSGKLVWQWVGGAPQSSEPASNFGVRPKTSCVQASSSADDLSLNGDQPPLTYTVLRPPNTLDIDDQTWEARYRGACAERDYWKALYETTIMRQMTE